MLLVMREGLPGRGGDTASAYLCTGSADDHEWCAVQRGISLWLYPLKIT
jgi:hypothetical protein